MHTSPSKRYDSRSGANDGTVTWDVLLDRFQGRSPLKTDEQWKCLNSVLSMQIALYGAN